MKICIINPNSSADMTQVIERNARNYAAGEFEVDCIPTPGAPEFIGSYEDAFESEAGMVKLLFDTVTDVPSAAVTVIAFTT